MNREELIADARRDIADAERCQAMHITPATGTLLRRLREVTNALAAEQAHTPTDDEREALATVIEAAWGDPTWDGKTLRPLDRQIADAVLAAGFRRTVQGEPTDAQVEAALKANKRFAGRPQRDAMRAALRAAAATQEGENR